MSATQLAWDLAAESKRPHIDFSLGAGERLREMVEKRTPICLFELLDGHDSLRGQAVFTMAALPGGRNLPQTTPPFGADIENLDGNRAHFGRNVAWAFAPRNVSRQRSLQSCFRLSHFCFEFFMLQGGA